MHVTFNMLLTEIRTSHSSAVDWDSRSERLSQFPMNPKSTTSQLTVGTHVVRLPYLLNTVLMPNMYI